jgi:hypothetical protein
MKFAGNHSNPEMIFEISPRLGMVMFAVDCFLKEHGYEATWTSIIRPKAGDSGIHADKRAADMSIRDIPLEIVKQLCSAINREFPYDPSRPDMLTAALNDGGNYSGQGVHDHVHFQVLTQF